MAIFTLPVVFTLTRYRIVVTLQIEVHQDLPVGNNLQDHTAVIGLEFEIDQPLSVTTETFGSKATSDLYEEQRAGELLI